MDKIGFDFNENIEKDRVKAFEGWAKSLMQHQGLLVGSRMMTADSLQKMVSNIHSMIGAPKKREEQGEDDALGILAGWLNGGEVPEFAKAGEIKLPPLELEPDGSVEDEEEEEATDGS